VEAGLVKAVGVSNYGEAEVRRAHAALAAKGIALATNQVLHPLTLRAEILLF
jgi:diketogulonate reductase-like aldo/keto reductase